jgi:hypothetical protein
LDSLGLAVRADQGVKNGENVAAVIDHAGEDVAEMGVALGFPVPFGEDGAGHFNVAPQLIRGVAAKEKPIEKGRFALWELQLLQGID